MSLNSTEKELAAAIGFEENVLAFVSETTSRKLEHLVALSETYDPFCVDGVCVAVERQEVDGLLASMQPKLSEQGYRAFWSERLDGDGNVTGEAIVVLRTNDPYEIIRIRMSDGANYGVGTADILARLKAWAERCQFSIVGASGSWVALQFETLPENICEFAEEIYEFCPDTVEQGVGLNNERDCPAEFDAARQLCPQLSERMQQKLAAKTEEFAQMEMPPELREYFNAGAGFSTPTDMGIRLLAYSLKSTSSLFLWWD